MRLLVRKLIRFVVVLVAVSVVTFLMLHLLPGDVAYIIGGFDASPEDIQAIRDELGLQRPMLIRYLTWLGNMFKGDLGSSFLTHEPVIGAIGARLPVTLELILISQIMALLLAIPAGVVCAYRHSTLVDKGISTAAFGILSIPSFVLALLLIFVFALRLQWLPATGYVPVSQGIWPNLKGFLLPCFSIALIEWVPLMRVLRTDMIATLQEDFILMAKAKGMPTWRILLRDALKPSSLSLVTILGLHMGHWIGAAVIIETIFAIPGVGRLLVDAIFSRDVLLVQGCVLFITVAYVVINTGVDMLYAALDPRIRTEATHV